MILLIRVLGLEDKCVGLTWGGLRDLVSRVRV